MPSFAYADNHAYNPKHFKCMIYRVSKAVVRCLMQVKTTRLG